MFAVQAHEAHVTTIEGVGTENALHPVQEGFREEFGLQCGYCTPGMVVSAIGLLAQNPEPSGSEIRHAIEGNLCRCTGYQSIVAAIQYAAAEMRMPLQAESEPPAGQGRP